MRKFNVQVQTNESVRDFEQEKAWQIFKINLNF
jgi:hypothetical protein